MLSDISGREYSEISCGSDHSVNILPLRIFQTCLLIYDVNDRISVRMRKPGRIRIRIQCQRFVSHGYSFPNNKILKKTRPDDQ